MSTTVKVLGQASNEKTTITCHQIFLCYVIFFSSADFITPIPIIFADKFFFLSTSSERKKLALNLSRHFQYPLFRMSFRFSTFLNPGSKKNEIFARIRKKTSQKIFRSNPNENAPKFKERKITSCAARERERERERERRKKKLTKYSFCFVRMIFCLRVSHRML